MYNETGIKKTMLISPEHDARLKYYCKANHISASQLFRLFIDELSVSAPNMTLKDTLQETTFKTNNFVQPNKNIMKEVVNDGQGNIVQRWFSRREQYNTFPHGNHT